MFKSFQQFNQWWSSHVQSDVSITFTRAASRVATLFNRLSSVVRDYTSAYNSVQTLGYDNQGSIQDQTSVERLTVPQNIIDQTVNTLQSQSEALESDKLSFCKLFHSERSIPNMFYTSYARDEDRNGVDYVLPIDGYGSMILSDVDDSAHFYLSVAALDILGNADISDFPEGSAYALPNVVLKDLTDLPTISTTITVSGAHFPQILPDRYSYFKWRMILSTKTQGRDCYIQFDVRLKDHIRSYFGVLVKLPDDRGWITVDRIQPLDTLQFTNWESFIVYARSKGMSVPSQFEGCWSFSYDRSASVWEYPWSDMSEDQREKFWNMFTDRFAENYDPAVAVTQNDESMANVIFDSLIPLKPQDIRDAIQTLN